MSLLPARLLYPSVNPVCPEEFPETPLHLAVGRGSVEVARLAEHARLTLEPVADASRSDLVFKHQQSARDMNMALPLLVYH